MKNTDAKKSKTKSSADEITKTIQKLVSLIATPTIEQKEDLTGRTIGLKEFAKKYCYPHGVDWVKTEILYPYRPDWCPNIHPGRGKAYTIFEADAARWMQENKQKLNW